MEHEAEQQTRQKEMEMERMNEKYRTVKQAMDSAVCTKHKVVRKNKVVTEHSACPKCPKRRKS